MARIVVIKAMRDTLSVVRRVSSVEFSNAFMVVDNKTIDDDRTRDADPTKSDARFYVRSSIQGTTTRQNAVHKASFSGPLYL